MYDIASLRMVIALAGIGVAALALLLKLSARKPKRAEKWEKAEIMKKLLALSENDPALASSAPSVRLRTRPAKPGMRPSRARMTAMTSTSLPGRKAR